MWRSSPTSLFNVSLPCIAAATTLTSPAWIRIIFCQGPRQVINALTLYSVFKAKLDPTDTTDVGSTLLSFFKNIGILAQEEHQQAVILSGMLFTLVIWIFGALSMILAVLFYILFLWHYIPRTDGGLSGYCERKINRRLARIVSAKVNKAIEDEERKRIKADAKAAKNGEKPLGRQATLPTFLDENSGDKLPAMPMLNRNDTMTTLPLYSSRPGTPSSGQPPLPAFELEQLDQKRPYTGRSVTGSSVGSFGSNAPLMGNASDIGFARSGSPAPSLPSLDTNGYPTASQRTMTGASQNSNWTRGPPGPPRLPSAMGEREYTNSPVSYENRNPGSFERTNTMDSYGRPMPRAIDELRYNGPSGTPPSMGRRTPFEQYPTGRSSPAPGSDGRNSPAPSIRSPTNPGVGGYQPYNPNMRSATSASPNFPTQNTQYRNMTDPGPRGPPQGGDYFNNAGAPPLPRPGTANSGRAPNGIGGPPSIVRHASPGFGPMNGAGGEGANPMYRR